MWKQVGKSRGGRKAFRSQLVTVPLLLAITAGTALGALVLFPNREPEGRGIPLSLDVYYDVWTEDLPDASVIFSRDKQDNVTILVNFHLRGDDEPEPFEVFVSGAPDPYEPDTINFRLRPEWQTTDKEELAAGDSVSWSAETEFADYPDSGFLTNGETALGVLTAVAAHVPGSGYDGLLETETSFEGPTAKTWESFEWDGWDEYGGRRWVTFVIDADEKITSDAQLEVDGFNAAASDLDDRNLFIAGALLGVAGGAFTAAITEAANFASQRPSRRRA